MSDLPIELQALAARARTVDLPRAGGRTQWRMWGDGPPMVLLHGGSGSWMHWVRNIPELEKHYRLLVPDLPGSGGSDLLDEYSVEAMAADIASGAGELIGDANYLLCGFSFGAWVGAHMLAHHRDRVQRFVMVGTAGLGRVHNLFPKMRSWRRLNDMTDRDAAHRHNLEILMLADPASVDELALAVQRHGAESSKARRGQLPDSPLIAECLARWHVPLGAIWGERDAVVAGYLDERKQQLAELDPQADWQVIEGAGHWVQFEAAEAVNRFLQRQGAEVA